MANDKPMTLTSVKVKSDLFENFKIECVKRKFSFQKLSKSITRAVEKGLDSKVTVLVNPRGS